MAVRNNPLYAANNLAIDAAYALNPNAAGIADVDAIYNSVPPASHLHLLQFEKNKAARLIDAVNKGGVAKVDSADAAEFIHLAAATEKMFNSCQDQDTRKNLLLSGNTVAKDARINRLGM